MHNNGRFGAWSSLPHYWLHIQLPGYRASAEHHTYEKSRLEALPPIPIELDDDCAWLMSYGTPHTQSGLDRHERNLQPSAAEELAGGAKIELPRSFRRVMNSPELQSRVRSCTDCYLDPGERVVETVGSIRGHLVHFLSDSQSCAHWYLHILPSGHSAVLESPDLYRYQIENSDWMENPSCRLERIDLRGLEFAFCASSFSNDDRPTTYYLTQSVRPPVPRPEPPVLATGSAQSPPAPERFQPSASAAATPPVQALRSRC